MLSSNRRGYVHELVESLRDHLDESGTVCCSTSDSSAVQNRRRSPFDTNTEMQTAHPATDEETARDLMERLALLEEETTRLHTAVGSLTHNELRSSGKPKVFTGETREIGTGGRSSSKRTVQLEVHNLHWSWLWFIQVMMEYVKQPTHGRHWETK